MKILMSSRITRRLRKAMSCTANACKIGPSGMLEIQDKRNQKRVIFNSNYHPTKKLCLGNTQETRGCQGYGGLHWIYKSLRRILSRLSV